MRNRFLKTLIVVAVSVAATNAFASRARNAVLGSGDPLGLFTGSNHGSFFVEDCYNVFINPSVINDCKNWVTVEKSNGLDGAEGGFVSSFGNVNAGFFFDRGNAIKGSYFLGGQTGLTATTANTIRGGTTKFRPIEFLIGTDMGNAKLGLSVTYAGAKTGPTSSITSKAKELNFQLGADVQNFQPFFGMTAIGENEQKNTSFATGANSGVDTAKSKNTMINGGIRYKYGDWAPFAFITQTKFTNTALKIKSTTSSALEDQWSKNLAYGLGIGRSHKVNDAVNMHYAISYQRSKLTYDDISMHQRGYNDFVNQVVPLSLGAEADLASWFTARGGIEYTMFYNNTTTGRVGGAFHFGKVDVDMAIGNGGYTAGTAGSDGSLDGGSFDATNGLFSMASLTYRW